ncbi:hypothetical protein F9363_20835 [Escherichia coli]|nr:hypothetical protein [Escherichia coli]
MDVTNDDYIRLLSALLPPGPAWSASDPAIAGAAPSLTRVHQRADAGGVGHSISGVPEVSTSSSASR